MAAKPTQNNVISLPSKAEEVRRVASLKDGYTRIADAILEALARVEYGFTGRDRCIIDVVIRKTYGHQKSSDWISLEQFEEATGIAKKHCSTLVKELVARKVLNQLEGGNVKRLAINVAIDEWVKGNTASKARYQKVKSKKASSNTPNNGNIPNIGDIDPNIGDIDPNIGDIDPNIGDIDPNTRDHNKHINKQTDIQKEICPSSVTVDADKAQVSTLAQQPKPKPAQVSSKVTDIFDHWKAVMNHQRSQLDAKRRTLINNALKIGYTPDELKAAIDGCARTPHNMGQNDRGQVYDGLHVILRDADQIDRFIRNSTRVMNNQSQQYNGYNRPAHYGPSLEENLNEDF